MIRLNEIIQVFEYILTFSDELALVWHRDFNLLSALFLVNRYTPFADIALTTLRK